MYDLAICYYDGIGVRQNRDKAMELLKKAADHGSYDAKHWLKKQRPGF